MEGRPFFTQPDLSGVRFGPVHPDGLSPFADPGWVDGQLSKNELRPTDFSGLTHAVSVARERLPIIIEQNAKDMAFAGVYVGTQMAAQQLGAGVNVDIGWAFPLIGGFAGGVVEVSTSMLGGNGINLPEAIGAVVLGAVTGGFADMATDGVRHATAYGPNVDNVAVMGAGLISTFAAGSFIVRLARH